MPELPIRIDFQLRVFQFVNLTLQCKIKTQELRLLNFCGLCLKKSTLAPQKSR